MKTHCLCEVFRRFEGQPVRVYTEDGRVITGIVIEVFDDTVRIIDRCGRPLLIRFCGIDPVLEPQMRLHCCKRGSEEFFDCCEDDEHRRHDRDQCREEDRCECEDECC